MKAMRLHAPGVPLSCDELPCARGAIESMRKHLPDIQIALASDMPLGIEDIFVHMPDVDIGGRSAKIQIYAKAPKDWQYIAYLDADTEITAPETLIWDILQDGWDIVICKNPGRFAVASAMRRSDNVDECDETYRKIGSEEVLQLNGGVFAFQRNSRTKAFFRTWHKDWQRYGKRDQAALLRALWQHPIYCLLSRSLPRKTRRRGVWSREKASRI